MIYHTCIDVRNYLRTAQEAAAFLMIELAKGRAVIPTCRCDNFDYQKGCQGHPEIEKQSDTKKTPA